MKAQLLQLLKTYSFNKGEYKLSSGKMSEFFFDCKKTLLLAIGHQLAANLIIEKLHSIGGVDAVAGVELGGCPLASGVATISSMYSGIKPFDALYIRKAAKGHGTQRLIEGFSEGKNVVLLEDVITIGRSSMSALAALKAEGYNTVAVITIIDRLEGGTDDIRKRYDVPVFSLYTAEDFK